MLFQFHLVISGFAKYARGPVSKRYSLPSGIECVKYHESVLRRFEKSS